MGGNIKMDAKINDALARFSASEDDSVQGRLALGLPARPIKICIAQANSVSKAVDLAKGKTVAEVTTAALLLFDKGEPHIRAVHGELDGVAQAV